MLRLAATTFLLFFAVTVALAITEEPDPITLVMSTASTSGSIVNVDVYNSGSSPAKILVNAHYDTGSKLHSAQQPLNLPPGATLQATLDLGINIPSRLEIIENPDPIAGAITLGTVLWDD